MQVLGILLWFRPGPLSLNFFGASLRADIPKKLSYLRRPSAPPRTCSKRELSSNLDAMEAQIRFTKDTDIFPLTGALLPQREEKRLPHEAPRGHANVPPIKYA